jgi:hypothetical protein
MEDDMTPLILFSYLKANTTTLPDLRGAELARSVVNLMPFGGLG